MEQIPYVAYESALNRLERANKRIWIALIILIVALVGTNAGWVYYENQFVDTQTTIEAEQDGNGINIVGAGDIDYGAESSSNNKNEK